MFTDPPDSTGFCPLCGDAGAVALPCAAEGCRRLGLHRVPSAYLPPADRRPDPLVGRLFGDYLVVRRLGAGGVGAVYLALQQPIGLPAALKLLHADGSALATHARFRGEATALARLRHPNIVRLLKFGVQDNAAYLVMEYIEGARTLSDVLRQGIEPAAGQRVLTQLAHGLHAAHTRGIVHRDIKPANVMIESLPGEEHFVRVVDFGLAKFVEDGDSTQLAAGTPQYMAPEQALRREIGPWTDAYAVTVIACEMIIGHHPFRSRQPQSIIIEKCNPAFDPVASLDRPVGAAMARFLRRGLASAPTERYRDMPSLLVDLDAAWRERRAPGLLTAQLDVTLSSNGSASGVGELIAGGGAAWSGVPTGTEPATAASRGLIAPYRRRLLVAGAVLGGAALSGWLWWPPAASRGPGGIEPAESPIGVASSSPADASVSPDATPPPCDAELAPADLATRTADATRADAALVDAGSARPRAAASKPLRRRPRAKPVVARAPKEPSRVDAGVAHPQRASQLLDLVRQIPSHSADAKSGTRAPAGSTGAGP